MAWNFIPFRKKLDADTKVLDFLNALLTRFDDYSRKKIWIDVYTKNGTVSSANEALKIFDDKFKGK